MLVNMCLGHLLVRPLNVQGVTSELMIIKTPQRVAVTTVLESAYNSVCVSPLGTPQAATKVVVKDMTERVRG